MNPPNGDVGCRWGIGTNRDSGLIAGYRRLLDKRSAKTFTDDEAEYMKQSAMHHWLSIDCWTRELRSDKNTYRRPCSGHTVTITQSATHQRMFVTACRMNEYVEEKRTGKNLIVSSGISKAETTNNKILRSTFCI